MSEDAEVCLERFELLYPFECALNPVDCGPRIVPGYIPGGLAASCALQTHYYALHHDFGAIFEAGRLADIGVFLDRYDAARDGIWLLVDGGRVQGSIVIDRGGHRQCGAAALVYRERRVARPRLGPTPDVGRNGFLPDTIHHCLFAHVRRTERGSPVV